MQQQTTTTLIIVSNLGQPTAPLFMHLGLAAVEAASVSSSIREERKQEKEGGQVAVAGD